MSLHFIATRLCLTAQAATQQDPKAALLLIRPQQKKAKEQAEVLKTLKPNDRVVTSAGLIGVVISVKDNAVSLRCGDSKIEVTKASITEVTERAS